MIVSIIGYFVFHSLLDSSYKRTSTNSDHGNSDDGFGVDILDDEDNFEAKYSNSGENEFSHQENGVDDADVLNEIMMCISEVNREESQLNKHEFKHSQSSQSSPFVARTFNNMMKMKSMNIRSPQKNKGYQNLRNDDDMEFEVVGEVNEVEMKDNARSHDKSVQEEYDEFFAAIDNFESFTPSKEEKSKNENTTKIDASDAVQTSKNSATTYNMSFHNDEFAV